MTVRTIATWSECFFVRYGLSPSARAQILHIEVKVKFSQACRSSRWLSVQAPSGSGTRPWGCRSRHLE